ncbi:MAG: hypothetical protein QOF77_378 [Solirubrobacteraceae bacterium]|jgi:hypothetical protein|nr:hypothetical protein [Solirubrobacteraceae bacterium]
MEDRERQLAWEAAGRPRVAVAAIAGGLLLLAGAVYGTLVVLSGLPTVGLLQGLSPALHGQAAAPVDPHSARLAFIDHHAFGLILAAVLVALGTLCIIPVLRYLYRATVARLPRLPRAALLLAVGGAGIGAACLLGAQIVDVVKAHAFVRHGDGSHHAVDQATNSTPHLVLTTLAFASQVALAFAFVMIPLNAMRAGLLTRFMGVLGMVSGALIVILPPLQVLQAFWLVAFGVLISGRTATPLPPAWISGEAEPWPSQQTLRERRATRDGEEPVAAVKDVVPAPAPVPRAARTPAPNASKKRKKRR